MELVELSASLLQYTLQIRAHVLTTNTQRLYFCNVAEIQLLYGRKKKGRCRVSTCADVDYVLSRERAFQRSYCLIVENRAAAQYPWRIQLTLLSILSLSTVKCFQLPTAVLTSSAIISIRNQQQGGHRVKAIPRYDCKNQGQVLWVGSKSESQEGREGNRGERWF